MAWLAFVLIASIVWGVTAWWTRNSRPRVVARALEQVWQRLRTQHGVKDFYSGSEVADALNAAGVTDDLAAFAYARYCREADFIAAPACAGHSYQKLRAELLEGSRAGRTFPHRTPNV
jgi:hypothetical protein